MKDTLKPIFVLTGICLIVAVLLAATNGITAPIIAANAEATAQQTRLELLPEADNFEVVPVEAEGVTAENAYQIDTISGATISSNAAIVAVEHACAAYEALASGGQSAQSTQEGGVQE